VPKCHWLFESDDQGFRLQSHVGVHGQGNGVVQRAQGRTRRGRLAAGRCASQRSTVASGAVVVPASRDLDLDYWIFGLTLSDEEGQG
jgi:hypothetical protein